MTRPLILGLTGSIGMGKSTVAAMFREHGVPVFDADAQVRTLQGPGGALLGPIERAFPGSTGPAGVRRDMLGAQVFGDDAALARLEAIVHPAVAKRRAAFLERYRDAPLIVFDIPLLFEKGGNDAVDRVAVVSAPPDQQRARVLARSGMTPDKFAQIMARQVEDEVKRSRADHIIDTGVTLEETRQVVAALIEALRGEALRQDSPRKDGR